MKNQLCMKLFLAISLMFAVISSEIANVIDVSNMEICLMDTSFEGESEKEASENIEDIPKVKINQNVRSLYLSNDKGSDDASLKWLISTPYLEIHSPPPE